MPGSDSLGRIAQSATAAGAVVYAYGWYFLSVVLSRWSLSPEDVGVDFTFLVVRIAPFLLVVVLPVGALFVLLNKHKTSSWRREGRPQEQSVAREVAPATVESGAPEVSLVDVEPSAGDAEENNLLVTIAGWAGAVFLYLLAVGAISAAMDWVAHNWLGDESFSAEDTDNGWIMLLALTGPFIVLGVAFLIMVALGSLFDVVERAWRRSYVLPTGRVLKWLAWFLVLGVVGGMMYLPFMLRDDIVSKAERGESVAIGLPFLPLMRFSSVEVTDLDKPAESQCVVMLGIGRGYVVYLDPGVGEIRRMPVERTTLAYSCE